MRVTVFDYGAGNLHSIVKAMAVGRSDGQTVRRSVVIEPDPRRLSDCDLLVLPGVGAFGAAAERLAPGRASLRDALLDGLPCLGVCLGMQLLFDASDEGPGAGLGVLPGRVTRLTARRVPHIGWNSIEGEDPLLPASGLELAYFANGFACRPDDPSQATAWTTHETDRFPAIVRAARTIGVQFHPEKSSTAGLLFLRAAALALTAVNA